MTDETRESMIAPCGIDCGICEMHLAGKNEKLKSALTARGIPEEILPCSGCRASQGKCPLMPSVCSTFSCVQEKKVDFCFQCSEFPCSRLQPAADRAAALPHNLKVFNLCKIRQLGTRGFLQQTLEIKKTYYQGKMKIGAGPAVS